MGTHMLQLGRRRVCSGVQDLPVGDFNRPHSSCQHLKKVCIITRAGTENDALLLKAVVCLSCSWSRLARHCLWLVGNLRLLFRTVSAGSSQTLCLSSTSNVAHPRALGDGWVEAGLLLEPRRWAWQQVAAWGAPRPGQYL